MNRTQNKKYLQLFIHISAWMLVFGLPFFLFQKDLYADLWQNLLNQSVVLTAMLTVFYLNFFVLTEKVLFKKKIWLFLLYNLILIVLVGTLVHFWKEAMPDMQMRRNTMPPPNEPINPIFFIVFKDIFPLMLTTGLSVAVRATGKWYELESRNQEGEKRRTEAELMNLRQQINPHFLFNTLNNIYALIAISPDKAQSVVHDLSKLLRYVLYENNEDKVLLSHEMEFIVNYVELMRIRLTSDVTLKMKVESVTESHLEIAPMLVISLIENAFKHGVSPNKESFVDIDMHLEGNSKLVCRISNSLFPKNETDRSGSGIGLENLRRRLEILYPGKHSIINTIESNVYISELIIFL
jgi:two-component sensor histidine kinase